MTYSQPCCYYDFSLLIHLTFRFVSSFLFYLSKQMAKIVVVANDDPTVLTIQDICRPTKTKKRKKTFSDVPGDKNVSWNVWRKNEK